ncbi:MAG: MFS transporter [Rhodospirillaceae bacterium]|nr:MFS transporter [Rhodospirillaceae bacterium]
MSDTESSSSPQGAVTPGTLIKDRNFRRIWIAGSLGWMMRWLELLAGGVFTFEVTGSALMVALLTMVRMLPMLLFSAFTGAIADRFDRRLMLLWGLGSLAVVSAILATLSLTGLLELWHVAVGAFASGVYMTLEFPVRRTMLGIIAGAKAGTGGAGMAMTLDSGSNHCMRLVGPIVGGLLLETYGLPGVYVLGTTMFTIGFLMVLGARYEVAGHTGGGAGPRILAQIIEGFGYIRTNPRVMATLYITVAMNLCGFPYGAMVPVIGDQVLGQNATATGLLISADAAGALLGVIAIANLARPRHYGRIYLFGSVIFLCAVFAFSLSYWYPLSLGLLFLGGLGVSGFAAMQSTIVFTSAPPEMRGRLMGVVAICIGSGPIGVLQVGLLANWFGGAMSVSIIAVEGLLALLVAAVVWPHLHRR